MSPPGLAPRRAAAALLGGVRRGTSLADQITDARGPLLGLGPAERARAQALAATALRHRGRIDLVLDAFLGRSPPAPAMDLLRIAAAEMLLDGVPGHAAVDAAVRLARAHPKARHQAALINAVGRRVAAEGEALWLKTPEPGPPPWLATRLEAAYGPAAAAAIAAAHVSGRPPLDLSLREPATARDWAARLDAEVLPTGSLRRAQTGQVSGLPGYSAGAWWVQDGAAAMPARLLGDVAGRRVLDMCAAPGGKTLQLAAGGARVTALDMSEARLVRLRENLARTRLQAEIVVADALEWAPPDPFDAVLLDPPCTATGTIRRHPELPYLRADEDIAPLVALQARLMDRAWTALAFGGTLVFATCSLLPEEGEAQVIAFLARTDGAVPVVAEPARLGVEAGWVDGRGGLRLRPDFWAERGGMDGFYAVALRKRA